MSDLHRYDPDVCDGDFCPMDCDRCPMDCDRCPKADREEGDGES